MWTPISKPTGANYTLINPQGRETYDDISVMYDDPNVFYDGINQSAWSGVTKPTSSAWSLISKPV